MTVSGDVTQQSATPEPPRPVALARTVWITGAVLGSIRSLLQIADRHSLLDQLRARAPELSQDQLNSLASTAIGFGLLLLAGFLALNVWIAVRMASGRHWARMLLLIIAGVELVFGLIGLVGLGAGAPLPAGVSVSGLDIAFSVVGLVVDVVTLLLLTRPESVAYFRRLRVPRPPAAHTPPPNSPFL